jgi:flagellar biosynthesis protein FlhB
MSEGSDDDDSKTFEPTEKKIQQAIESGDLPVSREAALLGALCATLMVCSLTLRDGAARLADTLAHLLEDPARWRLNTGADAGELIGVLVGAAADLVAPIFLIFVVAGLAVSFAQNAPSVVLDRIMPKFSKISPAAGISKLISKNGAIEFLKSLFKLLIMGLVAGLILQSERASVADMLYVSPSAVPDRILTLLVKLLSGVTAAFFLVAVADYGWTKMKWRKRMMMTRQEVKDEHKQNEGDPMVKAKRRSLALDRRRRRMMADVPRATLVIANPTHFSIALRYKREEGGAPIVIAKGQDLLALKIREIATEHGISVVENKPLARSMYDLVEVGELIPPEFYKAVAEVIHYIQSRDSRRATSPVSTVMN